MNFSKKKYEKLEKELIDVMINTLSEIYSNKNSDEYKSHGNITLSPAYKDIEKNLSNLSKLKGYPSSDATNLKNLFNALHRPIYNKMVTEYLAKPNERNMIFTAVYTVGYRLLIGELSRIYASTEATEKGIVYKPDRISRKSDMNAFIKNYNADLERRIDEFINNNNVQEAVVDTIAAMGRAGFGVIIGTFNFLSNIFRSAQALNPVALMDAILMRSYDKKIRKFDNACGMYWAAKDAYDEYMKIPEAQRQKKIESKYIKMIEKYNIKMNNLKAEIEHYDSRAVEEADDAIKKSKNKKPSSTNTNTSTSSNDSSSDDDFDF